MPAIVTQNLRNHNAEQFIEALSETANSIFYVFIGKPYPWNNNTVELQKDSSDLIYKLYDEMVAVKKITANDLELVIPRYDWVSGVIYNHYDNSSNTQFKLDITSKVLTSGIEQKEQQPFYVLADTVNFNVYKCIANSKGAPSVVKPTGTSVDVITAGDGYQWKYMYTIPVGKRSRFFNSDFMYVTDYNNSSNEDGALDFIRVTNGGSQYTSAPTVSITGDGTGATATAVLSGNVVSNVNIDTRGLNYRFANVSFSGGGGSNAAATAIIGPKGGHAANAALELGGVFVMLAPELIDSENDNFPLDNDFRTLGILKDPLLYGTSSRAFGSSYSTRKALYLSNVTGSFSLDEYITGSTSLANAVVSSISVDSANSKANVRYFQAKDITLNSNAFANGEAVVGVTSGAIGNLISVINEGIQPDTGQIIYVDTFAPIQRSSGQTEILQLVIEF